MAQQAATGTRTSGEEIAIRERNLTNHWMMFGVANCVEKLGSRWQLMFDLHPCLFRTKREAMEAADALVIAIGQRRMEAATA